MEGKLIKRGILQYPVLLLGEVEYRSILTIDLEGYCRLLPLNKNNFGSSLWA
jgi:hypothetical protein